MKGAASQYLSQGVDYLGFLEAKLRDLRGFDRVAYELIQNADDAPDATKISFDLTDQALIVKNNGSFRNEDFERMRRVASRGKRKEKDTIGSFGIGFISVYHITDHPEIISSGRHWIFRPEKPENRRIEQIEIEMEPGTRFVLPWAKGHESPVRKGLRLEAVRPEQIQEFLQKLSEVAGKALLFLRKVKTIEIYKNGDIFKAVKRTREDNRILIQEDNKDISWHIIRGTFDSEAQKLKKQYPQIEEKRKAEVVITIPDIPLEDGLLFAYLPTEYYTALPFHVNADFFPSSDRRQVIFDSGYQSEWNRSAIRAAAKALRDNVKELPHILGHKNLWQLVQQVRQIYFEANKGKRDHCLSDFWNEIRSQLQRYPLIYTQQGRWVKPSEAFLLEKWEPEGAKILSELEILLVHDDLRSYFNLLRSEEIGVKLVTISQVADALKRRGLTRSISMSEVTLHHLRSDEGYRALWALLESLSRQGLTDEGRVVLKSCALARCRDGKLWPLNVIYQTDDEETIELFSVPPFSVSFLDKTAAYNSLLKELVSPFTLRTAISLIRSMSPQELEQSWKEEQWDPRRLSRWFENHKRELLRNPELKKSLGGLPIFPAGGRLRTLEDLVLPGDFKDPLGLTEVVDLNILEGCRDFLRDLGMSELTFITYARDHIPRTFDTRSLPPKLCRRLLTLLAERLGQIRDQNDIRGKLAQCPLVECMDGEFRKPAETYLDNEVTKLIFGDSVSYVRLPREGRESVKELLQWLGVASEPRLEEVVRRITNLVRIPPSDESVKEVQAFFKYLGNTYQKKALGREERNRLEGMLVVLKSLPWLPAEGDRSHWYRPADTYATFRRHLFETQARFLDMPYEVQRSSADFMSFLQIQTEPKTFLVVRHLLHCARQRKPVSKETYNFLNQKANEPEINLLRDKPCLLLPDGRYVRPDQVFWAEHPFGRYRYRLGPELMHYKQLFDRLGVKERPDPSDAAAVILEISEEFGQHNRPLDENTYCVLLKSWEILSRAIVDGEDIKAEIEKLVKRKTVPDGRRMLTPPDWMFFEDRPGLTHKFKGLEHNVIPRPEGAWPAMSQAGVCQLSKAVQSHLLECGDSTFDDDLTKRLRNRRHLLTRIVDPYRVKSPSEWETSILERLTCYRAKQLVIKQVTRVFDQEFWTEEEEVSALYHQDTLYYSSRDGEKPWLDIARELTFAMNPSPEAASLTVTLKEVLAASSAQDAEVILDQSGLPPLQKAPLDETDEPETIHDLGGESVLKSEEGGGDKSIDAGRGNDEEGQKSSEAPVGTPEKETGEVPKASQGEALIGEKIHHQGENHVKTGVPKELPGYSPPFSGTKDAARPKGSRPSFNGGRLRTYVTSKSSSQTEEGFVEHHGGIDRAGVERVKQYERRQGRNPKEMPPNHPGYDIESFDSALKNVVRYIEVKALSGEWTSFGVGLTETQFKVAEEKGEWYWLYVVERADKDDYRIILVQDPARKVNQFLYDNGWKEVAEIYSPDMEANGMSGMMSNG